MKSNSEGLIIDGIAAFIDRDNIDTDQIIPTEYLKSIKKFGFEDYLFDGWRYQDDGKLGITKDERIINEEFILNIKPFNAAKILLSRDNFGCGSSREHAVWALRDFGIKAVIASSFGDIFYNNCFKNGVLPIKLDKDEIIFFLNFDTLGLSHIKLISILFIKYLSLSKILRIGISILGDLIFLNFILLLGYSDPISFFLIAPSNPSINACKITSPSE